MRAILRDLARQRWRTALTIAGMAIGIFALVVFGAMAEHFRGVVAEAKGYVRGTIRIVTKTNRKGERPGITPEDVKTAREIPGVVAVVPTVTLFFDAYNPDENPIVLTPVPLVEGLALRYAERMRPGVRLLEGRWLKEGDETSVMVVRWLAERRNYTVGKTIEIRHRPYTIVGIYEAPDVAAVPAGFVSVNALRAGIEKPGIALAKKFFLEGMATDGSVPAGRLEEIAEKFLEQQEERFYLHEVIPEKSDDESVHELAERLRRALPHIGVIEPEALARQMQKAVAIFLAITAVVSVVSSIVGGLLIVNTMAMAVVERRREVAIKVAVGASPAQVALEFLAEATVMGLVGAILGVLAGIVAIAMLEPWILGKLEVGSSIFRVTPELLLSVVGFGVGLGIVAGLVPGVTAARSDPANGLREL